MRLLFLLLLTSCSLSSLAQERPNNPAPKPDKKATSERGTRGSIVKPPDGGNRTQGTSVNSVQKSDSDQRIADQTQKLAEATQALAADTGRLATYTAVLIIVGILQFVALVIQALVLRHHGVLIHEQTEAVDRQTVVLREQNAAISRQAAADEASANAATLSAETLINSERAWVVVTNIRQAELVPVTPGGSIQDTFVFDVINRGKTVARITGPFLFRFSLLDLDALTPIPDYGPQPTESPFGAIHGAVLVPGDSINSIRITCWSPVLDAGVVERINKRKATLYVYASIKYFDSFDRNRELQLCYQYHPRTSSQLTVPWQLSGPAEYNKHS